MTFSNAIANGHEFPKLSKSGMCRDVTPLWGLGCYRHLVRNTTVYCYFHFIQHVFVILHFLYSFMIFTSQSNNKDSIPDHSAKCRLPFRLRL